MPTQKEHNAFHNTHEQLFYAYGGLLHPVPHEKEEEVSRLVTSQQKWGAYTGIPIAWPVAIPMYVRRRNQTARVLGLRK